MKAIVKEGMNKYIGGAGLQFWKGMQAKYLEYEVKDTYKNWEREWFYIEDHAPALPPRTLDLSVSQESWHKAGPEDAQDQVGLLMDEISTLKGKGLTGARVFMSFLQRRVQPLQSRTIPEYKYQGKKDPSHLKAGSFSEDTAFAHVQKYLKNEKEIPLMVVEYDAKQPPREVCSDLCIGVLYLYL